MDKKINLINKFRTNKFPVEVLYNTEENDKYNFTVKMKCEKGKEYAVLFVNRDENFYTAEILSGDERTFSVNKLKIAKCEKIRIVDIETEQAIYEADFKVSSNDIDIDDDLKTGGGKIDSETGGQEDVGIAPDDNNIKIDQENDSGDTGENNDIETDAGDDTAIELPGPVEAGKQEEDDAAIELPGPVEEGKPVENEAQKSADERSAVKIQSVVTEPKTETENTDDIDFCTDYENDSSQSCVISDDEQDPYDIDLFMENTVKTPEIKKSQKAALINDNEGILDEVFEKFDLFETPLKNHIFYKLDETNAKKSALKIILNGFIVPVLSPLLEYQNPFGTSGDYPKFLIGETVIDGETEYYVYGALGRNLREEQPFSGATGFVYFEKIKDAEEGYWLMYVNAKTGRISLPMRPKNI